VGTNKPSNRGGGGKAGQIQQMRSSKKVSQESLPPSRCVRRRGGEFGNRN